MRRILACIVVTVLLASAVPMAVMPVAASPAEYKKLFEGDNKITRDELATEICSYMFDGGALTLEELRDASHVHVYWNGEPRTIVDSADRTVTIYKPIKKIVVLNSDAAEAVVVLGAGDKINGISDSVQRNTFYFPEVSKRTFIGKWSAPDWEEILRLCPDLVIAYKLVGNYTYDAWEAEKRLGPSDVTGITVVGLNLYDPDHIPTELTKLSILLESEGRASNYIEWYNKYKALVEDLISERAKPKVFMTRSGAIGKTTDIPTYGPGTTNDNLIQMVGGINIACNLTPPIPKYPKVGAEWVLFENPDIIIMAVSGVYGWDSETEPQSLVTRLLEGKEWDNLNATKDNRVYAVPWSAIYGMEQPFAMTLFGKIFHPDIDIKPMDVYKEFLEEFMGISYPKDKVFVYPPLAS